MQLSVEPTSTTEPRGVHLPTLEALVTKSVPDGVAEQRRIGADLRERATIQPRLEHEVEAAIAAAGRADRQREQDECGCSLQPVAAQLGLMGKRVVVDAFRCHGHLLALRRLRSPAHHESEECDQRRWCKAGMAGHDSTGLRRRVETSRPVMGRGGRGRGASLPTSDGPCSTRVGAPRRRTFDLLIRSLLRRLVRDGMKRGEAQRAQPVRLVIRSRAGCHWLRPVVIRSATVGLQPSLPGLTPPGRRPRLTIPPAIVRIERVH